MSDIIYAKLLQVDEKIPAEITNNWGDDDITRAHSLLFEKMKDVAHVLQVV
jgi:hypothetical protein